MANWFCSSVQWSAVTAWAASTSYSVGDLRRQLATPAVGSERVFRCTASTGASGGAEPTWTLTKGSTTTDGGVTWTEVTGNAAYAWQAAHARVANALAWIAAGDTCWVGDDHAESQSANLTLTSPGTAANPCLVYCVDHTVSSPGAGDLKTTAAVTTLSSFSLTIGAGFAHWYGVVFTCGVGSTNPNLSVSGTGAWHKLTACLLKMGASGASGAGIIFRDTGNSGVRVELESTAVQFGNAGQSISIRGADLVWKNTPSAIAGSIPNLLFANSSPVPCTVIIEGVDLSAIGSAKTLVGAITTAQHYYFRDCKLGSGVTVAAAATTPDGPQVYLTRCDSGAASYRSEKYGYAGTQTTETTIIRTNGAWDGATGISWKLATGANSKWILPLAAMPIAIWNGVAGSAVTATVEGLVNAATPPNNDEVWFDVEYLGASTSPLGSFASGTKANNLASGTALAASPASILTSAATSSGPILTFGSTAGVGDGYLVSGTNIPTGTYVVTHDATTVTLSQAVAGTVASGASIAFAPAWDGQAPARVNSASYNVGDVIKVASNPGRLFFCTTAGAAASSEPSGYATAVDGGVVSDGVAAVFRAAVRFKQAITFTPQMIGALSVTAKAAKAASIFYVDPLVARS